MKKPEDILKDFERSAKFYSKTYELMEKDLAFCLGDQWDDADVETLRKAGVKALTINKIKPILKLIGGIEKQSKSDFIAFPEGDEDGIVADISTSLLKNIVKKSKCERKLSEQFDRGNMIGQDFIEPYMDYSQDLINGELKLRNINPLQVYPDPDAIEYDLSDGKFLIKYSPNLSKDQLLELYPDKETEIEKIAKGKIVVDKIGNMVEHIQRLDYPALQETCCEDVDAVEYGYDLIEYQYKNLVNRYYVVDRELGVVQEVKGKKEAEEYASTKENVKVIKKKVFEIRLAVYVGGSVIFDDVLWCYPRWKSYSIVPYFPDKINIRTKKSEFMIQGIVRGLRDLQEEYNKRRTQELRHLNSSVNSGMMAPKGSLSPSELAKVKKYGSSPGIFIEYEGSIGKPERIPPAPISTAHAQLAIENAQDLKESSGVNPDLLANTENDQSGRAILLKQKQGLVMIQKYLDNYSETKRILGSFLLSQLGEVYTIDTAVRVLGESFLNKYDEFKKPVVGPDGIPVMDENGVLKTEVDKSAVQDIINKVLNDVDLNKYDLTIGEGAYSETTKQSNYLMLSDMIKNGIPIPPDILINESMLPQGTKQRINASIEQAQMMASRQAQVVAQSQANNTLKNPGDPNAGGRKQR